MRKYILFGTMLMFLTEICIGQRTPHCDTLIIGKSFNNIQLGIDDSASICQKIKVLKITRKTYMKRGEDGDKVPFLTQICLKAKGVKFFINCKHSNDKVTRIEIYKTKNILLLPKREFFLKTKINDFGLFRVFGRPTNLFRTKSGFIVYYEQLGGAVEYNHRIREKSISIFKPDDDWKFRYSDE